MKKFNKTKYQVLKKVITKDVASFFTDYYFLKQQVAFKLLKDRFITAKDNSWGVWDDPQAPFSYSCYADLVAETLLITLQPLIEKTTGQKLLPTYSYMRIYKKGDVLKKHHDRLSCEISATLNLSGDAWPIYFKELNDRTKDKKIFSKDKKIVLKPGDLAVYKGCELDHWREAYEGEHCVQVFLHYTNEKNKELMFDTRDMLGLPNAFKKFVDGSRIDFINKIIKENS
jgi:hypothetical protein|tara:strand:+ start:617 stop:1300 length:684 start_codon:yes stop_codon:yes gene_type:complete